METTREIKEYTRLVVTEIVDVLATREGTDWVLAADIGGLLRGTHFRNRDELVNLVGQALIDRLGARAGIRAA
jgi:hypothetical protein